MKRRKWFIGLLAAIVVIAVGVSMALVGPSWSSEEEAQARPPASIEQAMEGVRQFENASLLDLELTRMPDPLHSHIELRSGNTTYGVNPETGAVEMAVYGDNLSGRMEVVVPMEAAEKAAAAFAERHYPGFASLTLDESKLLDHGAGGTEYCFTWVELVNGVPTSNMVFLSVNPATGEVMTYIGKHQLIEPFDSASVSLEKAKEIAEDAYRRETGVKELTVGESLLGEPVQQVILVDGKQHLAWTVEVRESFTDDGIKMGALFFIDAHTGEVLQVFGF